MIVAEKEEKSLGSAFERLLELVVPQDKSGIDLMPYKKVLKDGVILTKEDTYQAFFKVKTTDLTSLSDDEFKRIVNKLTYLNRVYLEPYKIYSLTYPTDTIQQGLYWKHRIQEAKRELLNNEDRYRERYLKWNLKLSYDNLTRVELVETLPELMFVIVVYGKTQKELKNQADIMKQAGGKELGLQRLETEECENIIQKLMNPNSPL